MNKMNKANLKAKLALNRETLVRLDPVVLDEVNGGTGITVTGTTIISLTNCTSCK